MKERICIIDNCELTLIAKGMCQKHYYRVKRGKPLTTSRLDKRPAIIDGDVAKLPLGINAAKGYALVDSKYSYLDKYKWSIGGRGYAMGYVNGEMVKLHHVISGKPPKNMVTDHINRDKFDNTSSNLRFVSQEINAINKSMNRLNTSGIKGVCWDKQNKKWFAQIKLRNRNSFLGYFESKSDAAQARLKAEHDNKTFKEALHA